MDRIAEYRTYIKRGLLELRDLRNRSGSDGIEAMCAFDDEHGQYLLRYVGWDQKRRKDKTMLHVRLHNGKIWIETDDTEDGFATELLRCGIPATDIVLAFHPPQLRDMTDFAVA